MIDNKCYFATLNLIQVEITIQTNEKKVIYYKKLVVTYVFCTWTTTARDEHRICTSKRKMLRKMYGPIYNIDFHVWERTIEQLKHLYR